MNIIGRIKSMLMPKQILSDVPASVADRTEAIDEWFQLYKMKAPWLDYVYRTVDGRTRKRRRLTLNPAKVVCRELNSLVFAEDPIINGSDAVLEVLEQNNFLHNLKVLSEYTLALGGGAMKLRSDGEHIFIDFVKADSFVPLSWDNTRVTEASFVSHLVRSKRRFTLVETHKETDGGYLITNKMFDDQTNQEVALPYGVEPEHLIITPVPLFAYIKPAVANNFDPESPLGVSIYGNAVDTIKALDIAFDALNSEIVLGKKRIIVPTGAIRSVVGEDGKLRKYFDPTDEVYSALDIDDDKSLQIQDNSVDLRISEIKEAIQTLLDILAMQVGFSSGYLAFDGQGVKTATEVVSDNSKTFKTKQAYENNLTNGVIQIMDAIKYLVRGAGDNSIVFSDSVIEDRNSKATYWINLYSAGLAPLSLVLQKIHGVSHEDAQKMAEEINGSQDTVDVFAASQI